MSMNRKIDLKKRLSEVNKKSLNGLVSFTAGELSEHSLDELALIADMLEKVGVSVEVSQRNREETGVGYNFIVLKLNEDKYRSVMSRHAGRKADFERKYDAYGKCTVEELEEKLRIMKKSDIAKELGCSRMTLYRIINNISERNPAKDTSIWHYTS